MLASTNYTKTLDMMELSRLQESLQWRNYPSSKTPQMGELNPNREQLSEHKTDLLCFYLLFFGSTAVLHLKSPWV